MLVASHTASLKQHKRMHMHISEGPEQAADICSIVDGTTHCNASTFYGRIDAILTCHAMYEPELCMQDGVYLTQSVMGPCCAILA